MSHGFLQLGFVRVGLRVGLVFVTLDYLFWVGFRVDLGLVWGLFRSGLGSV